MSLKQNMSMFVSPNLGERFFDIEYAQISYPFFPGHASAFKTAADLLIDQLLSQSINYDSLVFPVLAMYRHSIEIVLKDLIRIGLKKNVYDNDELDSILGKQRTGDSLGRDAEITKHRLKPLWLHVQKLLNHIESGDDRIGVANDLINQLDDVDEDGQTHRYDREARSLHWSPYRFRHMPQIIEISNLRVVASSLFDYLESWLCYIEDIKYH